MDLQSTLVLISCLLSLFNLFATVLLSNSLFKIFAKPKEGESAPVDSRGLMDVEESGTYDPRFMRPKKSRV